MCSGLHIKFPSFLSGFNASWIFSTDVLRNNQISNSTKMGTELYRSDGQTDLAKLIVAFRNFANALNKQIHIIIIIIIIIMFWLKYQKFLNVQLHVKCGACLRPKVLIYLLTESFLRSSPVFS